MKYIFNKGKKDYFGAKNLGSGHDEQIFNLF
jgi:hypothetical protein